MSESDRHFQKNDIVTNGKTLLIIASSKRMPKVTEELLKLDVEVDKKDNAQMTAFLYATKGGARIIV